MPKTEIDIVRAGAIELMTRPQVAGLIQCSPRHVDNLRRAGKLPAFKLGNKLVRFKRSDVEAFIEKSRFN